MKLVGECIVGKKKAKEGFEYPIIRFPKEFSELIGRRVEIYQLDEKNFLVSLELSNWLSNRLELLKLDKNLLEKAKELGIDISSFLEEKLRKLLDNLNLSQGPDLNRGQGICSPPHSPSATLAYR